MLFNGDEAIERRKAKCRNYADKKNKEADQKVRNFLKRKNWIFPGLSRSLEKNLTQAT